MSSPLLDINVLLALAWPNHQFHDRARKWFSGIAKKGWSTCALTQLGFVRLSSNPSFTPLAKSPLEATLLLEQLLTHKTHRYLEDLPSPIVPAFRAIATRVLGHSQVTDAYLLSIATHNRVPFATFDGRIKSYAPSPQIVLNL